MSINVQKVQPGDLITASFFNDIVDALDSLQSQIDGLGTEGSPPSTGPGPTTITSVDPSPVVANAAMHIHGTNFLVPAELNAISLNGVPLEDFVTGSTDTVLNVMVPGAITTTQQQMLLSVAGNTIAQTTVTVAPPTVSFGGQVVVQDISGTLGTKNAGDTIPFQFSLQGQALVRADDFHVRAEFNNAQPTSVPTSAWDAATSYTGTSGGSDNLVTVNPELPPPTVGVNVRIPSGAKSVDMIVRAVSVNNDPASSNSSHTIPITVGSALPQGDAHVPIDFNFSANSILEHVTYNDSSFIGAGLGVKFGSNPLVTMKIGVDQQDHAGTYNLSAAIENPDTSIWVVNLLTQSTAVSLGQETNFFFQLHLVPTSVGTPGSERRYLTVTATRQDADTTKQFSNYLRFPIGGF